MTCVEPLDGYRAKGGAVIIVPRGERAPRDSLTKVAMSIPCQKCVGCRMENARQWGLRCMHEAKMWPHNSYVTLTYNDDHVPPHWSLSLRDVQLFMKRLRKLRASVFGELEPDERKRWFPSGPRVRFFLGGEYGDENGRPHYHALLFNCDFGDKRFHGNNKRGEPLYTSRQLSSVWSIDGEELGFCTIGAVTFDSAVYCAKYSLKRVNVTERSTPEAIARFRRRYEVIDENGEVFLRRQEFAVQSRNPGIGATYFDKYGEEVLANDSVVVEGREVRPPRYYDLRGARHDDHSLVCKCQVCSNRRKRKRMAVLNKSDNTSERLRVKERIMVIAAERKERKL